MTRPLVMGILNVTPDSFSDGGRYLIKDEALRHVARMVEEGADIIDVGGESSRPGAEPVGINDELDRVLPILNSIATKFPQVRISIDTVKASVAQAALDNGATLINDISGGSDIGMVELAKRPGVDIILMHMRGTPVTMQVQPFYPRGVVEEVKEYLSNRVNAFKEAGVAADKIWIDPGIGFGKTVNHNLEILNRLEEFKAISPTVVVGTSKKSFLAHLLGGPQVPVEDREAGTIATNLWAFERGASVFRVHEVGENRKALRVLEALRNARQS